MPQYEVSEAVARGHPDKVADQISDSILDAYLRGDPYSRVAVETLVSHGMIAVAGEISSSCQVNIEEIVREVLQDVGYETEKFTQFLSTLQIVSSIVQQSPDIACSVGARGATVLCAGDQGTMYGYACQDTSSFMPRSYEIARGIINTMLAKRSWEDFAWLGPDGKTQVALPKDQGPGGSIVLSWQHAADVDIHDVREALTPIVQETAGFYSFKPDQILINPSGRFVLGGPLVDTGLTGRKQVADSYGGSVLHGGGAYSGKDATKVDRSGAYMARWVAKHVVAAGLARQCEIQLVFSIGKPSPLHIGIDCYGTESIPVARILHAIHTTFDFSVSSILRELQLTRPLFRATAFGGHFGREEFPWEQLRYLEGFLANVQRSH